MLRLIADAPPAHSLKDVFTAKLGQFVVEAASQYFLNQLQALLIE